jgi:hypothetical protein
MRRSPAPQGSRCLHTIHKAAVELKLPSVRLDLGAKPRGLQAPTKNTHT